MNIIDEIRTVKVKKIKKFNVLLENNGLEAEASIEGSRNTIIGSITRKLPVPLLTPDPVAYSIKNGIKYHALLPGSSVVPIRMVNNIVLVVT